jgi:hypothetical protein
MKTEEFVGMVITGRFQAGWVFITSTRGQPCCGEIADIQGSVDGNLRMRFNWSAQKFDDGWFLTTVSERTFVARLCVPKAGIGENKDVIEVDYPHLDLHLVLYPRNHRNIFVKRNQVKPPPT